MISSILVYFRVRIEFRFRCAEYNTIRFLGVTIGSDVFMNSIERITAMQRTVLEVVPGEQDMYKKKKVDVRC